MQIFPAQDPIPLPAPVFFFKVLHMFFLSLHFVTVHLVLGGLLIGLLWNFWGRVRGDSVMVEGSGRIARSLPILMTYLINLGVPPLLFAQVLYGNALYTSSVLIGVWWISVVFLVILLYSLLYSANQRAEKGRAWWGFGLIALFVGMSVAKIYSTNMTLMLRPEIWGDMYRATAHGTGLPKGDPTVTPRWLFMLVESLTISGLGLVVLGACSSVGKDLKTLMVRRGGVVAAMGVVFQSLMAIRVIHAQPDVVQNALAQSPFYHPLTLAWLVLAAMTLLVGVVAALKSERASWVLALVATLIGGLLTAGTVVLRDGIRDFTLLGKGFDVWNRHVVVNQPVLILFLAVVVAGLILLGWLIAVAYRAEPRTEVISQ